MGEIEIKYSGFSVDTAIPLRDRIYYYFIREAVITAKYRIWASVFIINIRREDDPQEEVRDILKLLSDKSSLGVDVRVIIGDSRDVSDIREVNTISKLFLETHSVPVKRYKGTKKSTHSKYLILDDDLIILGSHNWTNKAFSKSEEDSLAVYSPSLNNELQYQFLSTWVD